MWTRKRQLQSQISSWKIIRRFPPTQIKMHFFRQCVLHQLQYPADWMFFLVMLIQDKQSVVKALRLVSKPLKAGTPGNMVNSDHKKDPPSTRSEYKHPHEIQFYVSSQMNAMELWVRRNWIHLVQTGTGSKLLLSCVMINSWLIHPFDLDQNI